MISVPSVRATPGLVAILTHKDVPGENSFGIFPLLKDQPVLAPGFVRFRGEAVLALVGDAQRRRGLSRMRRCRSPGSPPPPSRALPRPWRPSAPAIHATVADNVLARGNLRRGEVECGT